MTVGKREFSLILLGIFLLLAIPLTIKLVQKSDETQRPTQAATSNTIPVSGGNYYLFGVNYPWSSYGNDFGKNGFGDYGVHTDTGNGTYNKAFADMKAKGVHVVRWWVFSDGRAGITFDSSGSPTGIDSSVLPNLDAAVAIAKKNNIYLNLVFLDFSFLRNPSNLGGSPTVVSGGHANVITDATKTTALINNVVNPIMNHFPNEPYILSWEIMNEPEWIISNLPQASTQSGYQTATMAQFWNFASQFSNSVHSRTQSYVTVGSATLKWNKVWTNSFADKKGLPRLNLDYYQTHYYSWMDPWQINDPDLGVTWMAPTKQAVSSLGLDKPIVVGESDDNAESCGGNCANLIFNNGYAGYWPWSYWGGDGLTVNWSNFTNWESSHSSLVRIPAPGVTPPPPPPPVTPPPSPPPGGSLPSPWVEGDVGGALPSGSASYSPEIFTVNGGGADIWNSTDQFHYVYKDLVGNGSIVSRVDSQTNTDPWAKSGIMIRETTAANSKHVTLASTPGNGVALQYRASNGAATTHVGASGAVPLWFKLIRNGDTVSAFTSVDGNTWTSVGSATVSMANTVKVGLAVSSHNTSTLSTVKFSNVGVFACGTSGGAGCPPSTKPGDLNKDNSVNSADLAYLISKWGSNDATGDINGNGVVDSSDLAILISNWGK